MGCKLGILDFPCIRLAAAQYIIVSAKDCIEGTNGHVRQKLPWCVGVGDSVLLLRLGASVLMLWLRLWRFGTSCLLSLFVVVLHFGAAIHHLVGLTAFFYIKGCCTALLCMTGISGLVLSDDVA